jgi:hypothetical protein
MNAGTAADNWISGGALPEDARVFQRLLGGGVRSVDWRRVALEAWQSPSWREAAVEYHSERLPTPPRHSPDKLTASPRDIWRAAGKCIRRKAPHDALRTFLKWCDYCGVSRGAALPIFKSVVEKELAK